MELQYVGRGFALELTEQQETMTNSRRGWERQMALSCAPALMGGGYAPNTNDMAAAVTREVSSLLPAVRS